MPGPARQPRARGELILSARLRGGRSRIATLRQAGSMKALFPQGTRDHLQCVFLNTSGGVTGGDRFQLHATAAEGAHLELTSQAAERIYRAQPDETGRVRTRLTAGAGARIDWLPQETIVFEGARLDRRLEADLAPDATLLAVEVLVFGRAAMGEALHDAVLADHWRIRRDGVLVFADSVRLSGDVAARLADPAVAGGARAMASVLLAGPQAAAMLRPLRAALGPAGGASLIRDDLLFARALAPEAHDLRRHIVPAIRVLTGRDCPRTWML